MDNQLKQIRKRNGDIADFNQEKITTDTFVFSGASKNYNLIVPIPTLSPKINNSKGLETYTNTQYGFQFKYPTLH